MKTELKKFKSSDWYQSKCIMCKINLFYSGLYFYKINYYKYYINEYNELLPGLLEYTEYRISTENIY